MLAAEDQAIDRTVERAANEDAAGAPVESDQVATAELGLAEVLYRGDQPVPDTRDVGRLTADGDRTLDHFGVEIEAKDRLGDRWTTRIAVGSSQSASRPATSQPGGSGPAGSRSRPLAWSSHPLHALPERSSRRPRRAGPAHDRDPEARALCHERMIPPFRTSFVDSGKTLSPSAGTVGRFVSSDHVLDGRRLTADAERLPRPRSRSPRRRGRRPRHRLARCRCGGVGRRIGVDLAVAWSFVCAAVLTLERSRWRRSRSLFVGSGFALLAADLEWSRSDAFWTLGLLLEGVWVAVLAHFLLTFPAGRAWSRPAATVVAGGYAVALGGQLARVLVEPDGRDVLGIRASARLADAVGRAEGIAAAVVFVAVAGLVVQRLRFMPPSTRRFQASVLAGAGLAAGAGALVALLVAVRGDPPSNLETIARASALLVPSGLALGLALTRLRRSDASELVVELRTEGAASLRDRLARALGDPSLELAYRLDDGRYVDSSGAPTRLPATPERAVTPLTARGTEVAVLVHDPSLLDEAALVESVRATAGLVLENERLAAEVRARLAEVRASRSRIVAAADAERGRIERDLHDGAQQRLVTLSIALGLAASRDDASCGRSLAGAGRDRRGDRRAARARARDPSDAAPGRGPRRCGRRGSHEGRRSQSRSTRASSSGCRTPSSSLRTSSSRKR